jgi:hypothetical protein
MEGGPEFSPHSGKAPREQYSIKQTIGNLHSSFFYDKLRPLMGVGGGGEGEPSTEKVQHFCCKILNTYLLGCWSAGVKLGGVIKVTPGVAHGNRSAGPHVLNYQQSIKWIVSRDRLALYLNHLRKGH